MSATLPPGVRDLLTHRIDSFEKLEVVLALRRAERAMSSIDQLALAIGLLPESVRDAVRELRGVSLVDVSSTGEIQLLPPSSRDHAAVEALAKAYEEDRFAIVKLMGEIAMGRIRSMAAQVFADAFVIRKSKKDGDDG